jgi:hypothetical protein
MTFSKMRPILLLSAPIALAFSSAVGLLFNSLVLHLFLYFVRGAKAGLESTIKVVGFASAAGLWSVLPYLGSVIAVFWQLGILIVGFSAVNRISTRRAAVGILLPLIVLFTFLAILAAMMFGVIFSALIH